MNLVIELEPVDLDEMPLRRESFGAHHKTCGEDAQKDTEKPRRPTVHGNCS
jgi:hypothetical protein